jgi:acetylornithine deacetylase/succinyl-diaminopimelate desuccinylase-like protein
MDTTIASDETLTTVHAADPIYHSGWREGTRLFGNGVLNNKGVMASWMIACKALKSAGVRLKGDVVMTMVVGEIGLEPVDEFQSPQYLAKEAGARFLVNRGYVADYAIVAEGTDFTVGWVEAGKAFFKVTVMGEDPPVYTPYIRYTKSLEESPNAIERSAKVISAIKEWAVQYEQDNRYECAGGTVLPKVNIGAIRGGVPYKITKTPAVCYLYVDTRITPVQKPLAVQRELQDMLAKTGVPATAELYAYRRGYEATGVEPLLESLGRAHRRLFNAEPGRPIAPITSMWRDSNVFIEAGVPTVVYGPGGSVGGGVFAMEEEHLLLGARAYALTLLETCKVDLG